MEHQSKLQQHSVEDRLQFYQSHIERALNNNGSIPSPMTPQEAFSEQFAIILRRLFSIAMDNLCILNECKSKAKQHESLIDENPITQSAPLALVETRDIRQIVLTGSTASTGSIMNYLRDTLTVLTMRGI